MISRLVAGTGVSLKPALWRHGFAGSVAFVSEPHVFGLFGKKVLGALRAQGLDVSLHLLPQGEKAKDFNVLGDLLRALARAGLSRDSGIVALGGGAVTDAGGFAAAVFMRGIPWVSVPSTLLGQLDGGIGGKTAANLPEGKNLVGAFHQPVSVVCDPRLLSGLSPRDRMSGLAEALKIGLTFDPALWRLLRRRWDSLMAGDPDLTAAVVRRAAGWKLRVVARDERETLGARELLNFGHTVGHALEAVSGFGKLRHGEAVVWGMRAALRFSRDYAGLGARECAEGENFLGSLPVPALGRLSAPAVLKAARRDKKVRGGKIRFVLLERIGKARAGGLVPDAAIRSAVKSFLERGNRS